MKMKKKLGPKGYDEEMDKDVRGGVLDEIMGGAEDMMFEQNLKPILSITISQPTDEEDDEEMEEEKPESDEEEDDDDDFRRRY